MPSSYSKRSTANCSTATVPSSSSASLLTRRDIEHVGTKGDVAVAFAFDDCRQLSEHRGFLCVNGPLGGWSPRRAGNGYHQVVERGVAVDGEGTADVADAGGRVRRRVAAGGRSAQLVADTDGRLQVMTLFKALCCRHPDRFQPGQLRTLQRRVRDWRVQYGPDSEVYCRPRSCRRQTGPWFGRA